MFVQALLHRDSRDGTWIRYEVLEKGTLFGNPRSGVRTVLLVRDGAFHAVDPSELAFRLATIGVFLEPMQVVAPVEFQSASFPFPFPSSS